MENERARVFCSLCFSYSNIFPTPRVPLILADRERVSKIVDARIRALKRAAGANSFVRSSFFLV